MPVLTVHADERIIRIPFDGTPLLSQLLQGQGLFVPEPCGGRGVCGKCAVRAGGSLSPQREDGTCLVCQTRVTGDAAVYLSADMNAARVDTGKSITDHAAGHARLGMAVDIGTTTVALRLCDLETGHCLAAEGALNPQAAVAADVIGRIGYAVQHGSRQQELIWQCIRELYDTACAKTGLQGRRAEKSVICGNTAMLYLLTGRDPVSLSHAPFEADHLFGETVSLSGLPVFLPPCAHAFVGADVLCSVLYSGMLQKEEISLLCDIGTNGEIALYKDGVLYVTSTAAGPVFEGVGIRQGMPSLPGAVDRVSVVNGQLFGHVIGECPAKGICGSGILDAVHCLLLTEQLDETGAMDEDAVSLSGSVSVTQADIRAVQLGKAAIAAGIQTLFREAGCRAEDVRNVYIAGGFGSHMDPVSAVGIGLFPDIWRNRFVTLGNAAVMGAEQLLLYALAMDRIGHIRNICHHVDLGGNPVFNQLFIENMVFEDCSA